MFVLTLLGFIVVYKVISSYVFVSNVYFIAFQTSCNSGCFLTCDIIDVNELYLVRFGSKATHKLHL